MLSRSRPSHPRRAIELWRHRTNIPLQGKNWSEHERAEIGRLEAECSGTNPWSLECDQAGDPWFIIYDQQHHRVVLRIARIDRRYAAVWQREGRSAETATMSVTVDLRQAKLLR